MEKLLNKWLFEPNWENAKKVAAYNNKHSMAACLLTKDIRLLLDEALDFAKK